MELETTVAMPCAVDELEASVELSVQFSVELGDVATP